MANDEIRLQRNPPIQPQLEAQVNNPSEIDAKCDFLGVPAILANYHLAAPVDLSYLNMQLSTGVYIPKQIATREGGRKSQYNLNVGETIIVGIITTEDTMMLRHVTRLTGTTPDAQSGDTFREQLKSRSGELIYEGDGTLEIVDPNIGHGEIQLSQTSNPQVSTAATSKTEVWVLWSCIRVKHESES